MDVTKVSGIIQNRADSEITSPSIRGQRKVEVGSKDSAVTRVKKCTVQVF
jgi:hypothetical protein